MNRTKSVLAAASLLFAISLTLSCSGDSSPADPPTINGISSVNAESSSSVEDAITKKAQISGVSQKGPFIEGSTATYTN